MNVEPLRLKEVQPLLDPDQTLVEYFVGPEKTFVWVIRAGRMNGLTVPIGEVELKSKVNQFRKAVTELKSLKEFHAYARDLHRLLIAPVLPYATGKELVKRWFTAFFPTCSQSRGSPHFTAKKQRLDLHGGNPETPFVTMLIEEKVNAANRRYGLVCSGEGLLVAVSGGPDSVALLHTLFDLRAELSLHLEVAHLQHGIRGEEAIEDARFVAALAQQLGLTFHLKEIDLPVIITESGKGNLEALARVERYRFFADIVRERKLDKVATAHTQDDQAETIMMWILRGAGRKGLGGMEPLHRVKRSEAEGGESLIVVRPLLEVSKSEILEYLKEKQFSFRIDRSNLDPALLRNWIRLELLPTIERRAGEKVAARLSRQGQLIRDEDDLLDQLAQRRYDAVRSAMGLSRTALLHEAKALQRRVLRLWIEQTRGNLRGLDFVHVEELLRLINAKAPQGRTSIPGGWELVREYDALRLEKRPRGLKRLCYSYKFEVGKVLPIHEAGVEIRSERSKGLIDRWPREPTEALFDLDELPTNLAVRNFRPGDRFRPLGMTGHKKVKDLLIDNKVPLSIRATLPLLAMGQEVLWIPGYARSEIARVSEKTQSKLRIKVVSIGA